jgi:hypothetical protein
VRLCYAEDEESPAHSPRSSVNGRPQMIRRQDEGCYYSMEGASLADGTLHGVRAHAAGRISVTYGTGSSCCDRIRPTAVRTRSAMLFAWLGSAFVSAVYAADVNILGGRFAATVTKRGG